MVVRTDQVLGMTGSQVSRFGEVLHANLPLCTFVACNIDRPARDHEAGAEAEASIQAAHPACDNDSRTGIDTGKYRRICKWCPAIY